MSVRVRRCVLCGDAAIDAKVDGRFVTTSCPTCHAVLIIEFDPPDEPSLRARIERIDHATARGEVHGAHRGTRSAGMFDNRNNPVVRVASRRRRIRQSG
jgi:hypothetical protein